MLGFHNLSGTGPKVASGYGLLKRSLNKFDSVLGVARRALNKIQL